VRPSERTPNWPRNYSIKAGAAHRQLAWKSVERENAIDRVAARAAQAMVAESRCGNCAATT
jgi:hypothetical protein